MQTILDIEVRGQRTFVEQSSHLDAFPLAPLGGVFHLVAGVEAGEGREGVDPGAAGAREGAHEAGDAAQGGDALGRQRRVHQQLRHQVPGLVDDREVHAVAGRRPLGTGTKPPSARCCGTAPPAVQEGFIRLCGRHLYATAQKNAASFSFDFYCLELGGG